jgi:hypothetical protein
MENKTKHELQIMLKEVYTEIQIIDYKSIYTCFLIKNQEKRNELLEQVKKIKLEIIYREDDEKRLKYEYVRKNDPLKDSFKKIYMEYIMQK